MWKHVKSHYDHTGNYHLNLQCPLYFTEIHKQFQLINHNFTVLFHSHSSQRLVFRPQQAGVFIEKDLKTPLCTTCSAGWWTQQTIYQLKRLIFSLGSGTLLTLLQGHWLSGYQTHTLFSFYTLSLCFLRLSGSAQRGPHADTEAGRLKMSFNQNWNPR